MLIDTHQHVLPPAFVGSERDRILKAAPVIPPDFINWTPQRAIDQMDQTGVASAILSVSTPGIWTGDAKRSSALARLCNDYAGELVIDRPDRFGMFAALPLPDIDSSLAEVERSLDVLKLDGIGLMSNYDGRWLGDSAFAPVFEELDRRGAIVFVHPTGCSFTADVPDVARSILEYPTDTTRTILSLLFSGCFSRFRNIRFVFSHGGGALAMVLMRVEGALTRPAMAHVAEKLPNGAMAELSRQYYDVTNVMTPAAMAALVQFVPTSQLLFGSDFPYWPVDWCVSAFRALELQPDVRAAIGRNNALKLFPRFGCRESAAD
jgi:predicted TIM-barrel fold metal-dependent hydrolase